MIEIIQITRPEYTAQCALAAICLHTLPKNDFNELARRTRLNTKILNQVIKKNIWSTEGSKKAGEEQRSIAIGVAGLADYMAKHKIDFVGEEAKEFNAKLTEVMYSASRKASSEIEPKVYGTEFANSTFLGFMPTASTSTLLGVVESFEATHNNIGQRRIDAGEFITINKYLVRDLKNIDLWDDKIRNSIIANGGSVQQLDIPEELKQRYKTIWEHKQKDLIELASIRAKNIDQSQSMNLYFREPTTAKIGAALLYAWEQGLPTGCYYCNTPSKLKAPINLVQEEQVETTSWEIECYGCSS